MRLNSPSLGLCWPSRATSLLAATALLAAACGDDASGDPAADTDATTSVSDTQTTGDTDTATATTDADTDTSATSPPTEDMDLDNIPDSWDNCVGIYNPGQEDIDQDGIGDPCDETGGDADNDRVPDIADLWPDDPNWPGVANTNTVYANTSKALWRLEVKTQEMHRIDLFGWPSNADSEEMTDIAIDRYGVMYAISFDDLFICHPQTAECRRIASLPTRFNGLTLVPKSVLQTETDALVGISTDGGWWRMNVVNGAVQTTYLGEYGGTYTSSGDAFSIEGVGTFAAVSKGAFGSNKLVSINPATGAVLQEIADFAGHYSVFG
ncbi:MAG: hypothetical protein ACI9MR_001079, partial [Myxococcota bacterium]